MNDRDLMRALITAINDMCNEFSRFHDEMMDATNDILKQFCYLTEKQQDDLK